MEISKLKGQGLLIKTKTASLAIDPQIDGKKLPSEAASVDFILSTLPEQEINKFNDQQRLFSWPGEYEVKGIAVHAHLIEENEPKKQHLLFFVIYTEEGKLLYMPQLKEELHSDLIEKIGDVDLMIFPAVGDEKIWHSSIEEIEPKSIMPLQYEAGVSIDSFLSKIGLSKPAEQEKITLKSKSDFRNDGMSMAVFLLS